jgi:putative membrane protein
MHWIEGTYTGMRWWWVIGPIVIAVIVWLSIRLINQKKSQQLSHKKSALDILNERYAGGEIDKEEYEQRKKDLM